tara:strand:+ start:353 stop:550 length:198 start_codon:yes stop_codon:yes gene_type:complete
MLLMLLSVERFFNFIKLEMFNFAFKVASLKALVTKLGLLILSFAIDVDKSRKEPLCICLRFIPES